MAFWNVLSNKKKSPQELLAAGNFKGALVGFQDLLKRNQSDPVVLMHIADLYLKLGKRNDAREYYIRVGENYGDMGFFNKAVAVFKKALNITPGDREILNKLASYNDKVPKYMLDTAFLKQAIGEGDEAPHSRDVAAEPEPLPISQEPPTELPLAVEEPEPADAVAPPIQPPIEVTMQDHDIDFEGLDELSEELSHEFAKDGLELPSSSIGSADDSFFVSETTETAPPVEAVSAGDESMSHSGRRAVFSARTDHAPRHDDEPLNGGQGGDYSSLDDALDSFFSQSVSPESKEQDQKHWPIFRTMPKEIFMDFVLALETRDYEAGVLIVHQGDPGDEMFLIADGEVEVVVEQDRNTSSVARLGEGDFFGEASLLTGAPRNATVRTLTATNCLLLNKAHLYELAKTHPTVMTSIESIYRARLS